jgi:hypothetical protein
VDDVGSTPTSESRSYGSVGTGGLLSYAASNSGSEAFAVAALSSDVGGSLTSDIVTAMIEYYMVLSGPQSTKPGVFFEARSSGEASVDGAAWSYGLGLTLNLGNSDLLMGTCFSDQYEAGQETITTLCGPNIPPALPTGTTVYRRLSPGTYALFLTATINQAFVTAPNQHTNGVLFVEGLIDPYIYIDPTDPLFNEYTLAISDGIINSPPSSVSEPSALALLGIAFGLLLSTRKWLVRRDFALPWEPQA